MKFEKKHRDACQAHYGDGFLLKAMCDLHINKHRSHVANVMAVGDDIDEGVLSTIWSSLTSWGRQIFTASSDMISLIQWTAVAATESIPIFLIQMKNAAERLINATGSALSKAATIISKSTKQFWDYLVQLFSVSNLTQTSKAEAGQSAILSISDILRRFGDTAVRVFNWLGKQLSKIIGALYRVIQTAISAVSDITGTYVDTFNSIASAVSPQIAQIKNQNYELVLSTLSFSRIYPEIRNNGEFLAQEYVSRYGAQFGRDLTAIAKSIHLVPDYDVFQAILDNEYVRALTDVVRVSEKVLSWLADRFMWLARFLRGVVQFAVDAFSGFFQRAATVMMDALDVMGAMFMQTNVEMPQMEMGEMVEFADQLSKEDQVDPDNRQRLRKVIGITNKFTKTMSDGFQSRMMSNLSGVKLDQSMLLMRNTGKIMTQLITGYAPDIRLGDEITQNLYGKSMEEMIKESQVVYSLLFTEIDLALESVDSEQDGIDDSELTRRMQKYIQGDIEQVGNNHTWWSRMFGSKEDDKGKGEEEEEDEVILERDRILRRREYIARSEQNSVYDINPLTDAWNKKKRELEDRLERVRAKIREEEQITRRVDLQSRAQAQYIMQERTTELMIRGRTGKTEFEKKSLQKIGELQSITANQLLEIRDKLVEDENQILFELQVLTGKKRQTNDRVQWRTRSWTFYILFIAGILGLLYGGYTFYQSMWATQGVTIEAVRKETADGAKQLVEVYYEMWKESHPRSYLPWKISTPNVEALRQQGVLFMNNLQNGARSLGQMTANELSDFLQPYQIWLNRVASSEKNEEIRQGAINLVKSLTQLQSTDDPTADDKMRVFKTLSNFLRESNYLFVTGQVSGTFKRALTALSSGIAAAFSFTWRGGAPSGANLSPTGVFSLAAQGASSATIMAAEKLTTALIGIATGFYGLALVGTWLFVRPFIYISEGATLDFWGPLVLAIPTALGPFVTTIYQPVQEAAEAIGYARWGPILSGLSIVLLMLPGYGPIVMLKRVIEMWRDSRRQLGIQQQQQQTAEPRVTVQNTPANEYTDRASQQMEEEMLQLDQGTANELSQRVQDQLQKDSRQLITVAPATTIVRRRKKKKREPRPTTYQDVEEHVECTICGDIATVQCTHCNDLRSYCDHVCLVLDWNPDYQKHVKLKIND